MGCHHAFVSAVVVYYHQVLLVAGSCYVLWEELKEEGFHRFDNRLEELWNNTQAKQGEQAEDPENAETEKEGEQGAGEKGRQ